MTKFGLFLLTLKYFMRNQKKEQVLYLRKNFNKVQYGSPPPPKRGGGGETKIIVMQLGKPAVENLSPFSDLKMRVWF